MFDFALSARIGSAILGGIVVQFRSVLIPKFLLESIAYFKVPGDMI